MGLLRCKSSTYDHTYWKTRDPVRSPIDKPVRGGLVVGSVTTSESPLLYVSIFFGFVVSSTILQAGQGREVRIMGIITSDTAGSLYTPRASASLRALLFNLPGLLYKSLFTLDL